MIGITDMEMFLPNYPPLPKDQIEAQRVEWTRKCRRLLYGQHRPDIDAAIREEVGNVRRTAWGKPDLSSNPFLAIWSQLAALYNEIPRVIGPQNIDVGGVTQALEAAGYWQLMQRVQRDTLGMREMLVRVDVVDGGKLVFRLVYPDLVEARVDRAGDLVWVREAIPDGKRWVFRETDLATRTDRVFTAEGVDITADYLGGEFSGAAYPWIDSQGAAYLPYIVYHAAETGFLWDWSSNTEIAEGSIRLSVYLTYFGHILKNAAWAQRYVIGAHPAGGASEPVEGSPSRTEVVTDPATLLQLEPSENAAQPQAGQWTSPTDPESVLRAISMYERRVLALTGLHAPDVTRAEADIRSGYSLIVTESAKKQAQKLFEPQFLKSDRQMLSLVSRLLNRSQGSNYPENELSWMVIYPFVLPSSQEAQMQADRVTGLVEKGLMDKITAYTTLNPGTTRIEAQARLEEIAKINRSLS